MLGLDGATRAAQRESPGERYNLVVLRDPGIIDVSLDPVRRQLLGRLVGELRRNLGDRVGSVTLYGSFARGDPHEESDIDLLVLLRDEPTDADRLLAARLAVEVEASSNACFVPSVILLAERRFAELRERELRFALDVEREGIRL